jgi:hypothetical protein
MNLSKGQLCAFNVLLFSNALLATALSYIMMDKNGQIRQHFLM